MKKVWSFLMCVIIVLCFSCKKDPPPEKTTYFMDEDFVDCTIFKPGSWWVYKKDSTTQDSVYVIKSEINTVSADTTDYDWQRSVMQYRSTYSKDTITSLGDFIQDSYTFYSKQKSSAAPSSEVLDFFSLKPIGYILDLSPSLKMKYDTVRDALVDSIPFTNVRIYTNLVTPSNSTLPRELWYAKNVGVVRKELFNGEVWKLVKYNAVQ